MRTNIRLSCLVWAVLFLSIISTSRAADLAVSADFPSGSGEIQNIDQQARVIRLVPTAHKGRGWACWWYVKVSGITPGETVTLNVGPAPWATPDQAVYSTDGGKTWLQTSKGERAATRIIYKQQIDAAEALFAWGPPFTVADAEALVKEAAQKLNQKDGIKAEAFELCRTREGRSTPALRLTPPAQKDGKKPRGLFVCARQHAWESGSSWVGRGFVDFLMSDDSAAAQLRQNTIIYFVPIMDIDNVAIGAGGKNQDPHDHNRDWIDKPVFPAVAAAQKIIQELDQAGTFDLFLDLHNPAAGDRKPFFFVRPEDQLSEVGLANQKRWLAEAGKAINGPLALDAKSRPSGMGYDKNWQAISGNWVVDHTKPGVVAVCLETSWNTPISTLENYRTVGRQLGAAVSAYLFNANP